MRYIYSLIRTTIKLRNLGILLFLFLNSALIYDFGLSFFQIQIQNVGPAVITYILFTIVYYAVILIICTLIIRLLFGGNRIIMGNDTSAVSLAFAEAYTIAKQNDPDLSDNIKLYACSTNYPDAYAFGHDTILISEPASQLSQSQLRTLFLEKFAQLSNHDSERMLFLIAGNAVFVVAIFIVKILVYIAVAFIGIAMSIARTILSIFTGHLGHGSGFLALSAYFNVCRVLSNAIEAVLLFFLNLAIRLALLSSRNNYYVNDQFVCDCGYSSDLRYYLQYIEPDISGFQSTLATITASKPSRLARLSHIAETSSTEPSQNSLLDLFGNRHHYTQNLDRVENPVIEGNQPTPFRVVSRTENETENHSTTTSGFRTISRNDE